MAIKKSSIENFDLSDGTSVYVQSSHMGGISLSFDGAGSQYMQRLSFNEAKELAEKLIQVLQEVEE
jgi:hypothetical protein